MAGYQGLEAEEFLENKGMMDGLFLVRDSLATTGEFALTVANNGRAFHYRICPTRGRIAGH